MYYAQQALTHISLSPLFPPFDMVGTRKQVSPTEVSIGVPNTYFSVRDQFGEQF